LNLTLHILETEIQVPNKTDDSTFVFTISNGTVYDIVKSSSDYAAASLSCAIKGGYLAVIDTAFKQDMIQNLIRKHLSNYTQQRGTFLFGNIEFFIIQYLCR
jgi:hypothetical protein